MNRVFSILGASALNSYVETASKLHTIEQKLAITLPEDLTTLLIEIGDAVMFDEGAKFKPNSFSGRESPDGFMSLDIFYGLNNGFDSILAWNQRLDDQLPKHFVAIGGSLGGDQICLERSSSRVFYWKHDAPYDDCTSVIALTFTDFVTKLEPDSESTTPIHRSIEDLGIIEEESHLDF